jgi:predicted  nucleic acid-binding Zn ribbon protein
MLERVRASGLTGPEIVVLGRDPFESTVCQCAIRSHFILYTSYIAIEPCLRCGDCFRPVPLYKVPEEHSTPSKGSLHDRLGTWQSNYRACDQLQMSCIVGEAFGLREMGRVDSALSKSGLAVCADIARLTSIPAYYYLHRYRGRGKKSERGRKCPGCGGAWLMPDQAHGQFDFKCDSCRLLSNVGIPV